MRYRLIFLILFYSQLFSQSTVFIKYKSEQAAAKSTEEITQIINAATQDGQFLLKAKIPKIFKINEKFGNLNSALNRTVKIVIENPASAKNLIQSLESNPEIEYVQMSSSYQVDEIPTDSLFSQQWGLRSINAPEAWDLIPANANEIILAVIDTGIDFFHPDIQKAIYKNEGELGLDINGKNKSSNGIDDDRNGFIDDYQGWDFVNKLNISPIEATDDFTDWDNYPMDEHGHGTNVSGIIGAEHNKIGIAGVNPKIKIMNLRAFDKNGNGEEDDAASAIIYAVKMGAKFINMSWGDSQYSQLLQDVIEFAYDNGVILIASSGNNSSDLPHYPSSFSQVISVGAIQENESLASFSNYGSTVDLVAPGNQIVTLGLNGTYKTVSGTSVSAPYVSAAASIIGSIKNISNEEIKQIIKSTARDLGDKGWDEFYGAGNLNLSKALLLLSPSEIKFNSPEQGYCTSASNLNINISCLSPYFKNYELYYGIGYNPDTWIRIVTEGENYQVFNENIYNLDLTGFSDTTFTIRLLMNRIDGNTQEERVNFSIDRTPPKILSYNLFSAMLNENESVQASIVTDDLSIAKLYFRKKNTSDEFNFILLDGFSGDIKVIADKHFGVLPLREVLPGIDHEFYFEISNLAGGTTIFKDGENYFSVSSMIENSQITNYTKQYNLPMGRIYPDPITISDSNEKFVFINKNETSSDMSIYKLNQLQFEEQVSLKNKIPITVGDFNNDKKIDLLNLFVKNGYIDSETEIGKLDFKNVYTDTSGTFWPAYADDIDNDGKIEIIVFSSDTTLTIWESGSNLNLTKESTLTNFVKSNGTPKSIFRNNNVLVDNFDDDPQKEIIVLDNFGRLVIFQINGNSNYTNEKVIEHFYPVESNSIFAKGDFNGDGRLDISILMEFEENVYITPLIYCSVISLYNNETNYLFQNMIVTTESHYINSFEKQHKSLSFADVDLDGNDDLIVFSYPNSYIFEFDNEKTRLLFYQADVNSQNIFIGDLDQNGIKEVGIPNGDKIFFHEFTNDGKMAPPIISDYYSLDSNQVYFKWNNNYPVNIYKGFSQENIVLYDSTDQNYYTDLVSSNKNIFYFLKYVSNSTEISNKSNIIKIYSHAPSIVSGYKVKNNANIEVHFSEKIESKEIRLSNFLIDENNYPSSVTALDEYSYLISTAESLNDGTHKLSFKNLRDYYNTPINDSIIYFEINREINNVEKFYITNYTILNNNNLIIVFNFKLDSLTALNKANYIFTPQNQLNVVNFYNNQNNAVILNSVKPFGSIGKEYTLKIENIFSSVETGFLPISKNSGSEIILTSNADNLDDMYVYPNPGNLGTNIFVTFANLTERAEIYIFSIDGIFINKIIENDGNGGVDWNLKDQNNNKVASGVYFYKALSLDNFGNTLDEKIGKFALIK